MIVVVAPGQGSQSPGMLEPWLADPAVRSHVERLGDAAGLDLVAHGTTSDADTIRDTAVAQPLIVAASLVALSQLPAERVAAVAGHSVGEITAAVAAGVLTEGEGMRFVAARGAAMADAARATETGMSAVVGGDEEEVLHVVAELGLSPANYNGGGQIVVAGVPSALAQLADRAPRGVRVVPLQVAGAFHTHFMAPAVDRLREVADGLSPRDPRPVLWTNRDGSRVDSGTRFLDLLVGQVSSPVRWDRTMAAFQAEGVTGVVELAPAGALVGLAKRGLRGTPTVAVKTPDDLPAAIALLEGAA